MKAITPTKRTKVKRMAKRGSYDIDVINKILDSNFICNVGFVSDGLPFVIPTCYGREGDKLFLHGSAGNRMLAHLREGIEACVTVSNVDAIVLARSAFHHSINYRSVVIFGKAEELIEPEEKINGLKILTEQIVPGRWDESRKPNKSELKQTAVFSLKINEASAKIRDTGVVDEEEDMGLNIWAGIIPLKIIACEPVRDPELNENILLPDYLKNFRIK